MILVDGKLICEIGGPEVAVQPEKLLGLLLAHPVLAEWANTFKGSEIRAIKPAFSSGMKDDSRADGHVISLDVPAKPRFVYVSQKEFATVNPLLVELIGTDEMTTCIGVVMQDPSSGLISVGHFDTVDCVVAGVNQLVTSVFSISSNTVQLHLVGAFDDSSDYIASPSTSHAEDSFFKEDASRPPGWSWGLASRMVDTLQNSAHKFELRTCCILRHNTSIGSNGHACPTVRGLVVETSSGRVLPARFDQEARSPDQVVRGVCTTTVTSDPDWVPSLLWRYETLTDTFVVSPLRWRRDFERFAAYMLSLSDEEILETYSTSPHAESPDFVPTCRRVFSYIQNFPDWQQTFPGGRPRIFRRSSKGGWIQQDPL